MEVRVATLDRLWRSVNRRMFELAKEVVHGHGLPFAGMAVMRELQTHPGISVSELARRTGLAKSHVSKTVESLAQQGLIEKLPDPADGRAMRLQPSAQADVQSRRIHEEVSQRLVDVLSTLPTHEIETLIASLQTLLAALDAARPAAGAGAEPDGGLPR